MTQKYLDELTFNVIGAAIEVHKNMGSGLLESVYQQCMIEELTNRNINFVSEFFDFVYSLTYFIIICVFAVFLGLAEMTTIFIIF